MKLKKNNMMLSFDFWVTTGSTTQIVPIKRKDSFYGNIPGVGSVAVKIS